MIITLARDVLAQLKAEGSAAVLEAAGVTLVADLCWCSITEPVFPPAARSILTNSGKYAHYAHGLSGREVRLGGLGSLHRSRCSRPDTYAAAGLARLSRLSGGSRPTLRALISPVLFRGRGERYCRPPRFGA